MAIADLAAGTSPGTFINTNPLYRQSFLAVLPTTLIAPVLSSGKVDPKMVPAVFEGVPHFEVSRSELDAGVKAVDLCTEKAAIFPSKGEMRKLVQSGGVSINKEKLAAADAVIDSTALLDGKYLLVQRGKKNYYLLIAK